MTENCLVLKLVDDYKSHKFGQNMQKNKEAIIAEYLTGDTSYRKLGAKYGIDFRRIHNWVSNYQGKIKPKQKAVKKEELVVVSTNEVNRLEAELRKAKLHNEVLEEMLKLSEQLTGIELRKKFGTKRL
jgi:transposase-like protein